MATTRTVEIDVELEPAELAEQFWNMGGSEQAEFFNELTKISDHRMALQMQAVVDSEDLTIPGMVVMQTIGEYGS